jgi:hypothetical protein
MNDSTQTEQTPPTILSWNAQEFEPKERHPDWVWYAGLLFAIVATISFFYGNIFFGIFLVVAGTVTIIYALRKPKTIPISIEADAISINNEKILFGAITQFWLDETGKEAKLLLLVKTSFIPTLSLPLEGVSVSEVREAIAPYAKEEELRESRSVALFDKIGF